jgi:hypothetical protein
LTVCRREFELAICGTPDLDTALLRRHTRYDGIHPSHPVVAMFWEVLESLTPQQQASIMRFVWARERLPPTDAMFTRPFIIARMLRDDPDSSLPQAHTCAFQVRRLTIAVVACCSVCSARGYAVETHRVPIALDACVTLCCVSSLVCCRSICRCTRVPR